MKPSFKHVARPWMIFIAYRNIKQSLHKHRIGIGVQIENASGEHCLRWTIIRITNNKMCLSYTLAQSNETSDCYKNQRTQNVQIDLEAGNSYQTKNQSDDRVWASIQNRKPLTNFLVTDAVISSDDEKAKKLVSCFKRQCFQTWDDDLAMQTMSKVVLIALHDIPWNQQAVMRIATMYSTTCDKTRHVHRGKVSLNGFRWEGEDSQQIREKQ